jgi:hypothetical protein
MNRMVGKAFASAVLLMGCLVGAGVAASLPAPAAFSVTIKNETGYTLEEVKYVLEKGETAALIDRAQHIAHGSSCTFNLKEGGVYRVYAAFTVDGKQMFAKGTAHNLKSGGKYSLTLQKLIISDAGAGMNFVGKNEFDAIK